MVIILSFKKHFWSSDSKDIYNIAKDSFELSIHQRIMVSTKILRSTAVFKINNSKKYFSSTKPAYLNQHLTLKTGVMAAEIADGILPVNVSRMDHKPNHMPCSQQMK